MVFQYPEHQIFAETIFRDVAFGPRNKGLSEEEVEKQVKAALSFVGLDYDTFANRSPFQLSGGQMRRVAIAGVVAMDPDYLILDDAHRLVLIRVPGIVFSGEIKSSIPSKKDGGHSCYAQHGRSSTICEAFAGYG